MKSETTLNDQQMNLLKEYTAAEQQLNDARNLMAQASEVDYEKVSSVICDAFNNRDKAACVFAASVAEEVANG